MEKVVDDCFELFWCANCGTIVFSKCSYPYDLDEGSWQTPVGSGELTKKKQLTEEEAIEYILEGYVKDIRSWDDDTIKAWIKERFEFDSYCLEELIDEWGDYIPE